MNSQDKKVFEEINAGIDRLIVPVKDIDKTLKGLKKQFQEQYDAMDNETKYGTEGVITNTIILSLESTVIIIDEVNNNLVEVHGVIENIVK